MQANSIIEIDRNAYLDNIRFIRELIGDQCKFSSVIKGNAYGHGIELFVPMAESAGVDHFSVFDDEEARQVFEASSKNISLMIMGYVNAASMPWVIEKDIEFFVFNFERLQLAISQARKSDSKARIHIELETGMNRTGFKKKDIKKLLENLKENQDHVEIMGLCTHLAGAESIANYYRITKQIRAFNLLIKTFKQANINPVYIHAACSAVAVNFPQARFNLARIGIMQYGFWPSRETLVQFISRKKEKSDPLKRIITWMSWVMDTKWVSTGEFIGYGTTFLTENDTKIAAVPVGYSHGYSRAMSNVGRVLINGQRLNVISVVNMNMMLIDVTSVPETTIGDEVILIGEQKDISVSVSSFSEMSNQLNYEMLTRLSHDIPRKLKN